MLNISMMSLVFCTFCNMSALAKRGESVPASRLAVDAFEPAGQVVIVLSPVCYLTFLFGNLYELIIISAGDQGHTWTKSHDCHPACVGHSAKAHCVNHTLYRRCS